MAKVSFKFNPFKETGVKISRDLREQARQDVADFIKEKVLEYIGDGKSPVSGGKWTRTLSPEYLELKKEISGVTFSNLELNGEMLDALEVRIDGNQIEVGVFDPDQAGKAEGNNLGTYGKSSPGKSRREFIPVDGKTWKREIWSGIRDILSQYEE